MCLFTHFAAGALAGGATGNVWAGGVAGLASHAVLDMIPHWDHPDWRFELAAGMASLVLLLLMPFATAPAVVGGLLGMAPDLENLFQKLGWMSRKRFVFPTHTGLLPHGRELGPRSVVWQVLIYVGCFTLLGLMAPAASRAAEPPGGDRAVLGQPQVTVLQADEQRTVVRLTLPAVRQPADWAAIDARRAQWAVPGWTGEAGIEDQPPQWPLALAVPTRRVVQGRVLSVSWWKEPAGPVDPAALIAIDGPKVYRGVPLAGAMVDLSVGGGILRDCVVEFVHPAADREREMLGLTARDDPGKAAALPAPPGLLNPDLYRRLAAGDRELARTSRPAAKASASTLFSDTAHWIKLDVPATGLYRVTGQDLAAWGVATSAVDPAKLRLYRGGDLPLDPDPALPDSLQARRVGLNEVPVQVLDGGDGEWNLDDELRFYGVGTSAWFDRFDPEAGHLDYFNHPDAAQATYWLTWEDDATPTPLPGTPRRVLVLAAPVQGGTVLATAAVRHHYEEQKLDARAFVPDGFVWIRNLASETTVSVPVRNLVAGSATRFVVTIRGSRLSKIANVVTYQASAWLNGDTGNEASTTFTSAEQADSLRVRLVGSTTQAAVGTNIVTLANDARSSEVPLDLDAVDLMTTAPLDLGDGAGALAFALWGDEVTVPGTQAELRIAAPVPGNLLLWDVGTADAAVVLNGTPGTGSVAYGIVRDPGVDRHFVAVLVGDLARPAGRLVTPVDLRARSAALDYIVIAPEGFMNAARDLADYRAGDLPGTPGAATAAVLVDDIYDNFSGGQKDWRAVRNYLRWVWEQGGHRLAYVCLLGNASRDPRNWQGRTAYSGDRVDLVPTDLRTPFPSVPRLESISGLPYASDDGVVSFEAGTFTDPDIGDLACGRLPALTPAEARAMVDRTIAYARSPVAGPWRNHCLFTADDANRPGSRFPQSGLETMHTQQAEFLAESFMPEAIDVEKIFGAGYPLDATGYGKAAAHRAVVEALDAGTTMFYYVGHGSQLNLGDENYFSVDDIGGLTNGDERFLFMAFSCDVGVYDHLTLRSMAERLVAAQSGGAIGALCASEVSIVSYNNTFSNALFAGLYPAQHVDAGVTVGHAVYGGKAAMVAFPALRLNCQRYELFGDPAFRLPHPVDDLAMAPASLDTLRTGRVHRAVAEAVVAPGRTYDLLVADSSPFTVVSPLYKQVYNSTTHQYEWVVDEGASLSWYDDGATVFHGTGDITGSEVTVPFKAPLQLSLGDRGRVRLIEEDDAAGHTAVARVPVVRSGTGTPDDLRGPAIAMAFQDNRYRVQPGTPLEATLTDTSGIAMVGTSPGNSILLEFDGSGFMTNVTSSFQYDANSYTAGRLSFGLPGDLAPGRHTAALYAADALGNVGSDTLSFLLVPAGVADIADVTLFPNPTPGPCRLIFDLSDPMEVRWDIYTVAGRRVRTVNERFPTAGPGILEWDGRDTEGDEIANGTYLYVVRGVAAARDGRDITRTGKLVIMR